MMFSFPCFSSDMKHFHLKLMEGKAQTAAFKNKQKLLNAGNELLNDNNHLHLILHV